MRGFRKMSLASTELILRAWNDLDEYELTEDAMFGPDALAVLGVEDAAEVDQLIAIAATNESELSKLSASGIIKIAPHQTVIAAGKKGPEVKYVVDKIEPTIAPPQERLAYLTSVLNYYEQVFDDFVNILDGNGQGRVFHADLVKPAQYVYGSLRGQSPELYFVDIEPDIASVAVKDEDGPVLSGLFAGALKDLSMMSHNPDAPKAFREGVERLYANVKYEGVLNKSSDFYVRAALFDGVNASADPKDYLVPAE